MRDWEIISSYKTISVNVSVNGVAELPTSDSVLLLRMYVYGSSKWR